MKRFSLSLAVIGTLLVMGCADLEVTNPNEPEAQRALATAGDVESLVGGAFRQYFYSGVNGNYNGPSYFLAAMAFQHSAWPANAGVVYYSQLPRVPIQNSVTNSYYGNMHRPWSSNYTALALINQGMRAIQAEDETGATLREELGASALTRLEVYSKFVQGLAHGTIALLYDEGYIIDENVEIDLETFEIITESAQARKPYGEVMTAALRYLDEAIALAEDEIAAGSALTIPGNWMAGGADVSMTEIVGWSHAMKARFMAAVARTPAEREAVDWATVQAEAAEGLPWVYDLIWFDYSNWAADLEAYTAFAGWQQLTYWILGMADQSGKYQNWVAVPNPFKRPDLDMDGDGTLETPFVIETPDQRFAQVTTYDELASASPWSPRFTRPYWSFSQNFQKPDRGTWRWSYYYWNEGALVNFGFVENRYDWPEITEAEMDFLIAEALYRQGNTAAAGAIVDDYRVADGGLDSSLDDTDADGNPNDMCVPRLPDGSCGDFFEMLKWEKRIAVQYKGLMQAPWYFEGRGWGELYEGTPLQFPVPCREIFTLGETECDTYGGLGGEVSSPGSIYNFPTEG